MGRLRSETYTAGPRAGLTVTNQYDATIGRRTFPGLRNGMNRPARAWLTRDVAGRLESFSDGANKAHLIFLHLP